MRLIDAEALHNEADRVCRNIRSDKIHRVVIHSMIENANTIDAVPVVRCGECKFSYKSLKQTFHCLRHANVISVLENDYCSFGEINNVYIFKR